MPRTPNRGPPGVTNCGCVLAQLVGLMKDIKVLGVRFQSTGGPSSKQGTGEILKVMTEDVGRLRSLPLNVKGKEATYSAFTMKKTLYCPWSGAF